MKDIFEPAVTEELVARIGALRPDARPLWGRMDVAQMLAHCCVGYEITYENVHPRPGPVKRFLMRTLVKPQVVGEKPYPRNAPTARVFRVADARDFERERERLIGYLHRTRDLGGEAFEGRDYPNFGPLTRREWSTMFHKHLDHHLRQFGV